MHSGSTANLVISMNTLGALIHLIFSNYPKRGRDQGNEIQGGNWFKTKKTGNLRPTLIIFASHSRPAKINRWQKNPKIGEKGLLRGQMTS